MRSRPARHFWVKQREFVRVIGCHRCVCFTRGNKTRMLCKRGWLSFWTPGCCTALEELGQSLGSLAACRSYQHLHQGKHCKHDTQAFPKHKRQLKFQRGRPSLPSPLTRCEWPNQIKRVAAPQPRLSDVAHQQDPEQFCRRSTTPATNADVGLEKRKRQPCKS